LTLPGLPIIDSPEIVLAATRMWLEKAVIGLGLCPFAGGVHLRDQIHYSVSVQQSTDGLLRDLMLELQELHGTAAQQRETSLLIHPQVLADFHDYNQFLDTADAAVRDLGLEGILQIASFHPQYQFVDCGPDDIENYSNRSPYPMLHLLREANVTHAVDTFPGIDDIAGNNGATLRGIGKQGWRKLFK